MTETVGQVVDRRGPCALMVAVMTLAEKHGRIPVGFWTLELEPGWTLTVNGTPETRDDLLPWHAIILRHGLPLVIVNAADGTQVADSEDACLEVLQRAIEAKADD